MFAFSSLFTFLFLAPRSLSEVGLLSPYVVYAQEGWTIDSFRSDVTPERSGAISVDEKIDVDFEPVYKHGIYRDIPYVYDAGNGNKRYSEINVQRVLQDGNEGKYELSRNESNIRIKIGDANKIISGKHAYEVIYTVQGVLLGYNSYDELYWNVTGNVWDAPITLAKTTVHLQPGAILKTICFEGILGSTTPCHSSIDQALGTANFSAVQTLQSGEGLTIVTSYQKGLYPIVTVQRPKTLYEKMLEPKARVFLGVMLVIAVGIAFLLWYKNGRDYSFIRRSVLDSPSGEKVRGVGEHETIVVEYEPPEGFRPGEIGVLTDEKADTLDVVATIIDLAGRGYLTITEIKKSWVFGSTDYLLTKKKDDTKDLASYELLLFDKLFGGKKEVKVSALKETFYTDLAEVKKSLYERVVSQKLFPSSPETIRAKYVVLGIAILVLGVIILTYVLNGEAAFPIDFGIGVALTGFFILVLSPFMSRRTGYGREMYRRVKGYQLFISSAEKYRQRFFEKKNLFNEVLPYAIVFGLTGKFSQAMKDIGLPEKQMGYGWYYGASAFNYATFSSGMNSFATSLSSAIASAPKSSGFSSGGGFSGGGFGGGGGGSW